MTVTNNRNILIVNCLKDDYDHEMANMSKLIQTTRDAQGDRVTVVDIEQVASVQGIFDEAIFVSHHRFYDPDLHPIPLDKRSVGGYNLEQCAETVVKLIQLNKVSEIQFYGCEMATDITSDNPVEENDRLVFHKEFNIYHDFVDTKISSLYYICHKVFQSLKTHMNFKPVVLRAINGMGYIKPEFKASPLGFEQKYLKEIRDIANKECHSPERKGKKRLNQKEDRFYHDRIISKLSPHQIEYRIDLSDYFQ